MHASRSISISSYLNHFETLLNHSIDITSTLTYPWTKSTVAAPSHPCLVVIGRRGRWVVPTFWVTLNYWAAASPLGSWPRKASLCPPLTLSPPTPTNRSPPSTLPCPKPTLPPYTITTPYISPHTPLARLCILILLPSTYLSLPGTPARPPCSAAVRRGRKILPIWEEEDPRATSQDPLYSLPLLACAPASNRNLTLPSL
jgi:hypothetical protein